jgi:hypothetical protein
VATRGGLSDRYGEIRRAWQGLKPQPGLDQYGQFAEFESEADFYQRPVAMNLPSQPPSPSADHPVERRCGARGLARGFGCRSIASVMPRTRSITRNDWRLRSGTTRPLSTGALSSRDKNYRREARQGLPVGTPEDDRLEARAGALSPPSAVLIGLRRWTGPRLVGLAPDWPRSFVVLWGRPRAGRDGGASGCGA